MPSIDELKIDIFNLLSRADGKSIDKCYGIYSRIIKGETLDDQAELFKYACEAYGTNTSTKELKIESVISDAEKEDSESRLGKYVNGLLDNFLRRNIQEYDFYRGLWEAIANDRLILESENDKAFAVYYILIDSRIPYFRLGTSIEMSTEQLNSYLRDLTPYRQKIRFILSVPIPSKTERAGYLLEVLDEFQKTPNERAALMVYLMENLKKKNSSISSLSSEFLGTSRLLSSLIEELEEAIGE